MTQPTEATAAPPRRELYSYRETRAMLGGVPESTFKVWLTQGLLIPVSIGDRRKFIRHGDIMRLIESGKARRQGEDR